MASFYVLPPRAILEHHLKGIVEAYLPGLPVDRDRLLELFHGQADSDHFILHREDLPEGMETAEALREIYGAEAGDRIVQVSSGPTLGEPRLTRSPASQMAA